MFGIIFKNNLSKTYFTSCWQLTKNYKILHNNDFGKLLFSRKLKPSKQCVFRDMSSKSLIIKQYRSSRKYTITWKLERLMGWSLFVLIPLAFAKESKELELILSSTALLHTYCGCQSMCSDYLRSNVVGKWLPIVVRLSIVLLSLASLAGAYQLIYEDIGLINMIKKFWCIRGRVYKPPKQLQTDIQEVDQK